MRWSFHTILRRGEYGADTWRPHARADAGAANDWAGFALDEKRGIVYASTGSAVPEQGYLYVFDHISGAPLFPIEERPVLASNVPGEVASRTQPRPVAPEPYARQVLTEGMLTTRTPEMHSWAVQEFRGFRGLDQFTPFAVGQPTVVFPGFDGGAMSVSASWMAEGVNRRRIFLPMRALRKVAAGSRLSG